jgi:hypothetical protein
MKNKTELSHARPESKSSDQAKDRTDLAAAEAVQGTVNISSAQLHTRLNKVPRDRIR